MLGMPGRRRPCDARLDCCATSRRDPLRLGSSELRATRICPWAWRAALERPRVPRLYSNPRPMASRNDSLPSTGLPPSALCAYGPCTEMVEFTVFTLCVVPGIGVCCVATEPLCPVRPERGTWLASEPEVAGDPWAKLTMEANTQRNIAIIFCGFIIS